MKILALDTATMTATCAVSENGVLLGEASLHGAKTHSQKLLPMVGELLRSLSLSPGEMDAFAVSIGPGSFTGLRIGVVTAKGLAYAAGKPVYGVPTLEALAFTVPFWKGVICPLVDARNQQAFCGFYLRTEHAAERMLEDNVLHVDTLADTLAVFGREVLLVGDCAARFAPLVRERWADAHSDLAVHAADPAMFGPRAAATALLAERMAVSGAPGDPFALEPSYMRPSQAERFHRGASR